MPRRPPLNRLLAAAAVLLVAGCSSSSRNPATGPVDVAVPSASAADTKACADVLWKLPAKLAGQPARAPSPASMLTRAWGDPAITVRCGVERPPELRETSAFYEVDAVTWFAIFDDDRVRYVAVDRRPYVEISVPRAIGGDKVMVPVGKVIAALPKTAVDLPSHHP